MLFINIDRELIATLLPTRDDNCDKLGFGKLTCICGSYDMPGAAVLSVGGALRSGVGLVTLASVENVCQSVNYAYPGAVLKALPLSNDGGIEPIFVKDFIAKTCLTGYKAILFGCGIGITEGGRAALDSLIKLCTRPLVIDADGLNLLAENISLLEKAACPIILTPHERELKRLLTAAKLDSAKDFAKKYNVTLVSKGAVTQIFGEKCYILNQPNSALAKGGSGDILAGLIAGLLAQGISPADAAAVGVYIHSQAGMLAAQMHTARAALVTDILDEIGVAFAELEEDI